MLPAGSEVGDAEFVVIRSASVAVATTSAATAVLFAPLGSVVEELTMTVLLIAVPAAVPAFTFTASVKLAVPGAKLASVQVMRPVPPTAGVMQSQPTGNTIDWKVVLGGVLSVRRAAVAVLGPALVTTCA